MRIFNKVIGVILVLVGLYFLGQNIIFTTETSPYFWKDISAAASVLAIALGIISLIFFKRETG
jgi:drug/metabolite transporter (DMT)-like permease